MGKLHKKMVALGDMTAHSYDSVVAACGQPKEVKPCSFSDIGQGTRATWSDGIFSITFNFDSDGKYCGIYSHRNLSPYLWLGGVTVVLVSAALIIGAQMRSASAVFRDGESLAALITESQGVWRTESTAGASLCDLDFDGTPELLAVDTGFAYDPALESEFFSDASLRIYELTAEAPVPAGGLELGEYCFQATLSRVDDYDPDHSSYWFYTGRSGETLAMRLIDGAPASAPVADPSGYAVAATHYLMHNESWVKAGGDAAEDSVVAEDITTMAMAWFSED